MSDLERLTQAGQTALDMTEENRLAQAQARAQVRADGLTAKTFTQVDAEQGLVELADPFGGRAFIQNQGSLSTGAIAAGDEVRADWRSADWPLPADGFAEGFGSNRVGSGNGSGSGGGSGGGGGGNGGDGDGDGDPPYCSSQILCYRGICYEDPAENDPPVAGQCSVSYSVEVDYTFNSAFSNPPSGSGTAVAINQRGPLSAPYVYQDGSSTQIISLDNAIGTIGLRAFSNCPPSQVVIDDWRYTRQDGQPDNCGQPPPPLGPPCDSDPEEWKSLCSSNPPIRYTTDTNSDRTLVIVTDGAGELARLDFKAGQYQVHVGCKEDGCPDADCSAQRFYYRDLPEPPDCPFEGGQCLTLYNVAGVGSHFSSYRGERRPRTFARQVIAGPISNPRIEESNNLVRWYIDGFNTETGEPETRELGAIGSSLGTVSDGAFESITIERRDGQPDDCGDLPECQPADPGPWTAGVLSFAPPIQTSAITNGDGSVTLTVYDGASSAADPLATYTLPDDTYETATRCEDEGPPPQ